MRLLLIVILVTACAALCPPRGCSARVISVPFQFQTIQEAVEDAAEGDTISVAAGTYDRVWNRTFKQVSGDVQVTTNLFIDRSLYLIGEGGPEGTVIQGARSGPVMTVVGANGVFVEGLTIRGGRAMEGVLDGGGGIYCQNSNIEIVNSVIEDNIAPFGGGVYCLRGSVLGIYGSVIRDHAQCRFGGAVALTGQSSATIEFCVLSGNRAEIFGGAMLMTEGATATVNRNTIVNNEAISGAAIFCREGARFDATNNIIAVNSGGSAVYCDTLTAPPLWPVELACNDFWSNQSRDTEGCPEGDGNRNSNPFFCSYESGDFSLCAFSPSLRGGDECGRRGALPGGCLDCPVDERRTSWGFLKSLYR